MSRKVSVIRHLRRRNPETVSTPHPRQFVKSPPQPKQHRVFDEAHPRRPRRPRRTRLVGLKAPSLEDYGVLIDQPRVIVGRPRFEPAVYFAEPGEVEAQGGELDGIARGKEKFLLVRRDAKGKKEIKGRALFKPASGEPHWEEEYGIPLGQQYIRESVMSQMNDVIGWNIVPATAIREVNGQIGSVQEWKDGTQTLWAYEQRGRKANELDYLKIATLDLISGNLDRHRGNVLVEKDGKMWAIDHGGGFPPGTAQFNTDAIDSAERTKIPAEIKRALRALDEGDLRAALAPLLLGGDAGYRSLEQAVGRWKWLKGLNEFPTRLEFKQNTKARGEKLKSRPAKGEVEMPEVFDVNVRSRSYDDFDEEEDQEDFSAEEVESPPRRDPDLVSRTSQLDVRSKTRRDAEGNPYCEACRRYH